MMTWAPDTGQQESDTGGKESGRAVDLNPRSGGWRGGRCGNNQTADGSAQLADYNPKALMPHMSVSQS